MRLFQIQEAPPSVCAGVGLGPIPYRFAGSNPASRISFSHAGENHVHAVNKGENPASALFQHKINSF